MTQHCAFIAICGRPNVGKSTLMNHLLGQKISITTRKPQTTRQKIFGVLTEEDYQWVFVDTPGIHSKTPKAINHFMNKEAINASREVDAIFLLVECDKWTAGDDNALQQIQGAKVPIYLVINKIDKLQDKSALLPFIESIKEKADFDGILPVSALGNHGLSELKSELKRISPEQAFIFSEDDVTDKPVRFLVAETIREKIMRQLGQEVPYETAVEIESWKQEGKVVHIHALVLVEKDGQKSILIGQKGARLKSIGSEARKDIENMLEQKVMLNLWVKVKAGWSDDERALKSLGFNPETLKKK